ncbi:hypothetical protein B5E84_14620, partial [Lachnoclostridium sp. An14]
MAARKDKQGGGDRMDEKKPPVIRSEWEMMARHMDKLQGKVERLERDRAVLFWMFVITAMALAYVLANVSV